MASTKDADSRARTKTMNISLPLCLHEAVRERVASGTYTSASEVMRSALRLLLSLSERPVERAEAPELTRLRWREARNALVHGEKGLAAERAEEVDELFLTALQLKHISLREERPDAPEEAIRKRVAAWLHERVGGNSDSRVDTDWERPVSEERFARIRHPRTGHHG